MRAPMHLRLVGARLTLLIGLIRESGLPAYQREVGLKDIHRQLLIVIGACGALSSQEMVALTGHEKAQVSRAVKPLEQDGLIGRERLRARFTLRPAGRKLYERIMTVGRARDARLTAGIAPLDLRRFVTITEALTVRAAQLYTEERRLSAEAGVLMPSAASACAPAWPAAEGKGGKSPPSTLIVSRLFSLVTYLKRSAMLAYQREHGLSNFQWQVLSLIGERRPLPLARLIQMMERDKSQVGRTVAMLEQAGLIERSSPGRRRDIMLEPTGRGMAIFEAMYALATRRDDTLWEGHDAADRAFYIEVCETLSANAQHMVDEERARAG